MVGVVFMAAVFGLMWCVLLTAQQSPKNARKSRTVRRENENPLVRVGKKMLSVSCKTAKLRRKRVFFARFRRDLRRV